MTPSMFPTLFILSLLVIGILYLTAAKFFQARKEKKNLITKESVQDWKNFFRKMGPAATGKFYMANEDLIVNDAFRWAFHEMYEEWFEQGKVKEERPIN